MLDDKDLDLTDEQVDTLTKVVDKKMLTKAGWLKLKEELKKEFEKTLNVVPVEQKFGVTQAPPSAASSTKPESKFSIVVPEGGLKRSPMYTGDHSKERTATRRERPEPVAEQDVTAQEPEPTEPPPKLTHVSKVHVEAMIIELIGPGSGTAYPCDDADISKLVECTIQSIEERISQQGLALDDGIDLPTLVTDKLGFFTDLFG